MIAGTTMLVAVGAQDRHYDARILDTPEEAVARLDRYEAQFGNAERTTVVPGPDQFFSNGPDLLKALKGWARDHGRLFHIHSSEEPNTTKWFKETYGSTPIEYADSIGVLDEQTVVAHQVNNTEHDLDILKERGVKVVHNPLGKYLPYPTLPSQHHPRQRHAPRARDARPWHPRRHLYRWFRVRRLPEHHFRGSRRQPVLPWPPR